MDEAGLWAAMAVKPISGDAAAALEEVPNSTRWKGVTVKGGRGGIVAERKGNRGDWPCDLWLAERL